MIYTPPPDTFSYLEPLDDMEQLGRSIGKSRITKRNLTSFLTMSKVRIILRCKSVWHDEEVDFMTLFDDFYQDEIICGNIPDSWNAFCMTIISLKWYMF